MHIRGQANGNHVLFQTFANANARIETTRHDVTQSVIDNKVEHNLWMRAMEPTQPGRDKLLCGHAKCVDAQRSGRSTGGLDGLG